MRSRAWVQIAAAMLSGSSLRQIVHTHCASVHQAAKLVAALLRVADVTAGLAESNCSLPLGLWLTSPAGWLSRTGISSRTLRSVIEYGLPLSFLATLSATTNWSAYYSMAVLLSSRDAIYHVLPSLIRLNLLQCCSDLMLTFLSSPSHY